MSKRHLLCRQRGQRVADKRNTLNMQIKRQLRAQSSDDLPYRRIYYSVVIKSKASRKTKFTKTFEIWFCSTGVHITGAHFPRNMSKSSCCVCGFLIFHFNYRIFDMQEVLLMELRYMDLDNYNPWFMNTLIGSFMILYTHSVALSLSLLIYLYN